MADRVFDGEVDENGQIIISNDSLTTMQANLMNLYQLIAAKEGIDESFRVTLMAGTLTLLSTLSNITQFGGQPLTCFVQDSMDLTANVGNIQNVAIV